MRADVRSVKRTPSCRCFADASAGGDGAVTDPFVSFDGSAVYYAYYSDVQPGRLNFQRGDLPFIVGQR